MYFISYEYGCKFSLARVHLMANWTDFAFGNSVYKQQERVFLVRVSVWWSGVYFIPVCAVQFGSNYFEHLYAVTNKDKGGRLKTRETARDTKARFLEIAIYLTSSHSFLR